MNKIVFLNNVLEAIFLMLGICLVLTVYEGRSFEWFLAFASIELFIILTGMFMYYRTKNYKNFTTHFRLTYLANLNELINDFITCDLYFHRQIGDCYTFSSKRRLWHNQMFFVEKIHDILHITCDQYSLNQLKQHPASFVLTGKVYYSANNQEDNSNGEISPIIFNQEKCSVLKEKNENNRKIIKAKIQLEGAKSE